MNIFVLCTGRCGSVSLVNACRHMANFTCGHETRAGRIGSRRLEYPENHIEADNRLSWYLGRLHFKYGDNAFYVHLKRELHAAAESYARRKYVGVMNAFASGLLRQKVLEDNARDSLALATDICETMTANIEHFLLDKTNKMEMQLENMQSDFVAFWERIGAEGDKDAALESLQKPANTSQQFSAKKKQGAWTRIRLATRAAYHTFKCPLRDSSFFDHRSSEK